jgi:ApbE superfamily uncharacterized protein (UPF0280 family)
MLSSVAPGKAYLDIGPVQMMINASRGNQPIDSEWGEAAGYVERLLAELSPVLAVAKLPVWKIRSEESLPAILIGMIKAVRRCDDVSLTPMAAVAGAFADAVADYLRERGATRVIVNNGGDIALRLGCSEQIRVGIAGSINAPSHTHTLQLDSRSGIEGIATSGFGGRSFTKGIATAAVVLGTNCRDADACATLIGNHTFSSDPAISQVLAEEIDPNTDLRGHLITAAIGELAPETRAQALANGADKARELFERGLILGAVVFIGMSMEAVPDSLKQQIQPAGGLDKNKF